MSSRQDLALAEIRAGILELQAAETDVLGGRFPEALVRVHKAHAHSGAAKIYLDDKRRIELAADHLRLAARTDARRPLRGRLRP